VSKLANHWNITAFEENVVPIPKLVVLLQLATKNIGAIGYRNIQDNGIKARDSRKKTTAGN
jgi:hypothetical protein